MICGRSGLGVQFHRPVTMRHNCDDRWYALLRLPFARCTHGLPPLRWSYSTETSLDCGRVPRLGLEIMDAPSPEMCHRSWGCYDKFSGSFESHLAKIRKAQVAKYSRYICCTLVYTVLQPPQTWSHSSPGGEGGGPLPSGLKDPKTDGEKANCE